MEIFSQGTQTASRQCKIHVSSTFVPSTGTVWNELRETQAPVDKALVLKVLLFVAAHVPQAKGPSRALMKVCIMPVGRNAPHLFLILT